MKSEIKGYFNNLAKDTNREFGVFLNLLINVLFILAIIFGYYLISHNGIYFFGEGGNLIFLGLGLVLFFIGCYKIKTKALLVGIILLGVGLFAFQTPREMLLEERLNYIIPIILGIITILFSLVFKFHSKFKKH